MALFVQLTHLRKQISSESEGHLNIDKPKAGSSGETAPLFEQIGHCIPNQARILGDSWDNGIDMSSKEVVGVVFRGQKHANFLKSAAKFCFHFHSAGHPRHYYKQ